MHYKDESKRCTLRKTRYGKNSEGAQKAFSLCSQKNIHLLLGVPTYTTFAPLQDREKIRTATICEAIPSQIKYFQSFSHNSTLAYLSISKLWTTYEFKTNCGSTLICRFLE
jgi:hypothetical protein